MVVAEFNFDEYDFDSNKNAYVGILQFEMVGKDSVCQKVNQGSIFAKFNTNSGP